MRNWPGAAAAWCWPDATSTNWNAARPICRSAFKFPWRSNDSMPKILTTITRFGHGAPGISRRDRRRGGLPRLFARTTRGAAEFCGAAEIVRREFFVGGGAAGNCGGLLRRAQDMDTSPRFRRWREIVGGKATICTGRRRPASPHICKGCGTGCIRREFRCSRSSRDSWPRG